VVIARLYNKHRPREKKTELARPCTNNRTGNQSIPGLVITIYSEIELHAVARPHWELRRVHCSTGPMGHLFDYRSDYRTPTQLFQMKIDSVNRRNLTR
jgi:hypothetical protein